MQPHTIYIEPKNRVGATTIGHKLIARTMAILISSPARLPPPSKDDKEGRLPPLVSAAACSKMQPLEPTRHCRGGYYYCTATT